jgi:hypothetical protein
VCFAVVGGGTLRPMPRWVATVFVAGTMSFAGCGGGGGAPKPTSVAKTQARVARLPSVSAGARCPVSRRHRPSRRFGPALGRGPVYPVGFRPGSVMRLAPPSRFNSHSWGGNKVLWVRRPGVRGDVVIRGQRLDGEGVVRFNSGDVPADQLILPDPQTSDWAGQPSYTRVLSPGCY